MSYWYRNSTRMGSVANFFPLVVLTTLQQFNFGLSLAPFPGNYIQWDFGLRHVVTGASHRSVTRFACPGRDAQMDWVAFGILFPSQSDLSLLVARDVYPSHQAYRNQGRVEGRGRGHLHSMFLFGVSLYTVKMTLHLRLSKIEWADLSNFQWANTVVTVSFLVAI